MVEENRESAANFEGSSQIQRFIPLLNPSNVFIDDRSIADFLVFIEKYSDYVYTHQIQEETSKDKDRILTWQSFFNSDISVFLAKIRSVDLNCFLPFYLDGNTSIDIYSQKEYIQQKMDVTSDFILIISNSYYSLLNLPSSDPKINTLLNYVEEIVLRGNVSSLISALTHNGLKEHLTENDNYLKVFKHEISSEQDGKVYSFDDLVKLLNDFFVSAHQLIIYSRQLFESSVQDCQVHSPGLALYIAFLKLYSYVQEDLNKITSRHLDYFYRDLLKQKEKKSEPDSVHVCIDLAEHVNSYTINKGTLFKAGIDSEGYDNLYQADDLLIVNKTKVKQFGILSIPQIDEIGLEDTYEYSSNIYQSEIKTSAKGGFDFSLNPVSLSAVDQSESEVDIKRIVLSEIGFAIASPILLLSEGKRACTLTLRFNIKSLVSLLSFVERYTKNKKTSFDSAFHQLFFRSFTLKLSTAEGWYHVETFKVLAPDPIAGTFKLFFELPKGAPSITEMKGDVWSETEIAQYDTDWPVLKCCLTNKYSMYMYTYLKELLLVECGIYVDVKDVKQMELFNDLGQLDSSTPFYPFGTTPVIGSSLLIGNNELMKKNIEDFSIELGWYNLPRINGGFKTYYKDYENEIETSSFKVAVTNLSDYEFHPLTKEKVQVYPLFSEDVQEGQLPTISSSTLLNGFEINNLKVNSDKSNATLAPYSVKVKSGYLKLELVSPEMGFGQSVYPSIFSSKIMKGSKSSSKVELPNPPYIPQLNSISLNYTASTKISFEGSSFIKSDTRIGEKMYLVLPFGLQTIFQNSKSYSTCFLPQYYHNGYLLLGLDELVFNEALTIYFNLEPSIGNEFEVDLPQVDWFYVSNDVMVPFDTKAIIYDTTNGFMTSGIVKLHMPNFMDNQNSILPKGSYWIVAAVKGDLNLVAKFKGVYSQALKLTWTSNSDKEGDSWSKNIPKKTIEGLLESRKEIANVLQPEPSFGGRNKEDSIGFYTRVSERLHHRNRCVTTWDYERMVLEEFPFVSQVKCVSAVMSPENVAVGEVILIVVPHRMDDAVRRFNYDVLQTIKNFILKNASPFINIQVINPVYEEVKVTASIRFIAGSDEGTGVEMLNRDLIKFICPWMSDDVKEMEFGGAILLEDLETFIYSLPYVHMVTNLSLLVLHYHDKKYSFSDSAIIKQDKKNVYASKPWSVLVSMKQHAISILEKDMFISPNHAAVSNLRLGSEFVLVEKDTSDDKKTSGKNKYKSSGRYVSLDIEL